MKGINCQTFILPDQTTKVTAVELTLYEENTINLIFNMVSTPPMSSGANSQCPGRHWKFLVIPQTLEDSGRSISKHSLSLRAQCNLQVVSILRTKKPPKDYKFEKFPEWMDIEYPILKTSASIKRDFIEELSAVGDPYYALVEGYHPLKLLMDGLKFYNQSKTNRQYYTLLVPESENLAEGTFPQSAMQVTPSTSGSVMSTNAISVENSGVPYQEAPYEESGLVTAPVSTLISPLKGGFVMTNMTNQIHDMKHHIRIRVRNIVQYRLQEKFSGRLLVAIVRRHVEYKDIPIQSEEGKDPFVAYAADLKKSTCQLYTLPDEKTKVVAVELTLCNEDTINLYFTKISTPISPNNTQCPGKHWKLLIILKFLLDMTNFKINKSL